MAYRSDIGFTPAVKAAQEERGSRDGYERAIAHRDWQGSITEELSAFVAERDSFYLATSSADGQPYVQHRGGPKGFLKVLDKHRLAFADYGGNRQYISLGNLTENDKAFLFLMDYPNQRRIKVWGTAEFVEGDDALTERVRDPDYKTRIERVLVFHVHAWDVNCRQHIRPRYTVEEISSVKEQLSQTTN